MEAGKREVLLHTSKSGSAHGGGGRTGRVDQNHDSSPSSAMYWGWTAQETTFWLLISWPCSKGLSSGHPQKGIVRQ